MLLQRQAPVLLSLRLLQPQSLLQPQPQAAMFRQPQALMSPCGWNFSLSFEPQTAAVSDSFLQALAAQAALLIPRSIWHSAT